MNISILLGIIIVVLSILITFITWIALRLSGKVIEYEEFYNNTLEDVSNVLGYVHTLARKRQLLSDDPDVQNLCQMIEVLYNILLGYSNAKTQIQTKEREEIK